MSTQSPRRFGLSPKTGVGTLLAAIGSATAVNVSDECYADVFGIDLSRWCYNQVDGGTPGDWQSPGTFHLTSLGTCQARSIFYDTRQEISAFTVTFTYRATNAQYFGCDHGAMFMIQNSTQGCHAVGNDPFGYGGISPSAEVSLQLSNHSGFFRNGGGGAANPTTPVNLRSGHPINVTITYDGTNVLTETLADTVTADLFSQTIPVGNLTQRIGSSTAYIGFTGGTTCGACSGHASNQYFSDFRYYVDSACPPDVNRDGTLNSQDYFIFLARFFAGTPDADYNRDGFVNSQDFFDFLAAFFVSC